MKLAAPINSPIAKLPASLLSAEKVENTSGDPFENARKVTPAYISIPSIISSFRKSGVRGKRERLYDRFTQSQSRSDVG